MKNTLGSIAWHIGVRKATIHHFCNDFEINLKKQIIEIKKENGSTIIKINPTFRNYLIENKKFLRKYENDYYRDKTPEIIAKEINQHIKAINLYIQCKHPEYFISGKFTPKEKYSLRYKSSYLIDFKLGGNYDFLKL